LAPRAHSLGIAQDRSAAMMYLYEAVRNMTAWGSVRYEGHDVLGARAYLKIAPAGERTVSAFRAPGSRSLQVTADRRQELAAQPQIITETFESFYRRDYRSLVGLSYAMTGSRWLAEELAQEAMAAAHNEWSTVGSYDDPAAWVRRVMVNKKISAWRRFGSEKRAMNRLRSQRRVEMVEIEEPKSEIWAAVRRLPRRQAEAIALFYWEDRPVAEIAEILGVSTETAKTHLKRARQTLAATLDQGQAGTE